MASPYLDARADARATTRADARLVVAPHGDTAFRLVGGAAATCFVGALITDVVYTQAPDFVWVTFSVWLITIGLILAGVAAVIGLIDRIVHHRLGALVSTWPTLLGFAAVVIVSIVNAFVHSRDAYQAVVPEGIALSAVAVALLGLTPLAARAYTRSRSRKSN